jgi:hypothetical protein
VLKWLDQSNRFGYHFAMNPAIVRNVALFSGLVLCGTACLAAAPFLVSHRGARGPLILSAQSPALAMVAVVICMFFASAIAGIVARMVNSAVGVFVLGAGVFVLASRMSGAVEVFMASSGQNARSVAFGWAVESLIWAVIALGGVITVFTIGGKLRDIEPDEDGVTPHAILSSQACRMAAAGALMLPLTWLIAKSPIAGQAMGATFAGGLAAGLAGRLIVPNVQPILLFISPIVFGAVAQVLLAIMTRTAFDVGYVNGDISSLANVMPVHYVAGSLMGVSMGIGWARSFLHHPEQGEVTHGAATAPAR